MKPTTLLEKWLFLGAVMADRDLSGTAKNVAYRLLDHHNTQTGLCCPSYETIAQGIGLKRRSVIYAVQELEKSGWVTIDRVLGGRRDAAHGYITNHFLLSFERAAINGTPVHHQTPPPGAPECTPPVHTFAPPPVHGLAPKTRNTETGKGNRENPPTPLVSVSENRARSDGEGSLNDAFEAWWVQYPHKKTGKRGARAAYEQAVKEGQATPHVLLAGVLRYAATRSDQEPRFTKAPANWLREGCWADEAVEHSRTDVPPRPRSAPVSFLEMARRSMRGQ